MRKIDVVIPSMWKSEEIFEFFLLAKNNEYIDNIIIINNDYESFEKTNKFNLKFEEKDFIVFDNCGIKVEKSDKITLLTPPRNLFISMSWNLAQKFINKNNILCLMNDDVVFSKSLYEYISRSFDDTIGIIGFDSSNFNSDNDDVCRIQRRLIKERPYSFGCCMFLDAKKMVWIPKQLTVYFNDDYLFDRVKGDHYIFLNSKTRGGLSKTVESDDFKKKYNGIFEKNKEEYEKIKKNKIKIAIYSICKNEEQNIEKWANSNKDADIRLVCDTGSTDNSIDILLKNNVDVYKINVFPWRFDIARNTALALLPKDIDVCIWQDFDEELLPGWREEIERAYEQDFTIMNHRYRNNNNPWQWHSKIHRRDGCIWTGAVHETLSFSKKYIDKQIWLYNLYLDEKQNHKEDRKKYKDLLELKIKEGDKSWKTYYFLANEYELEGNFQKSVETRIASFSRCDEGNIVLSYISKNIAKSFAYLLNDYYTALLWFDASLKYTKERETLYEFAKLEHKRQNWKRSLNLALEAIEIKNKREGYTFDPKAWDYELYDMIALNYYFLEEYEEAFKYGERAFNMDRDNKRLEDNLKFYKEKIK